MALQVVLSITLITVALMATNVLPLFPVPSKDIVAADQLVQVI